MNPTSSKLFMHTEEEGGSASLGLGLPTTQYFLVPGARDSVSLYVNASQV